MLFPAGQSGARLAVLELPASANWTERVLQIPRGQPGCAGDDGDRGESRRELDGCAQTRARGEVEEEGGRGGRELSELSSGRGSVQEVLGRNEGGHAER